MKPVPKYKSLYKSVCDQLMSCTKHLLADLDKIAALEKANNELANDIGRLQETISCQTAALTKFAMEKLERKADQKGEEKPTKK